MVGAVKEQALKQRIHRQEHLCFVLGSQMAANLLLRRSIRLLRLVRSQVATFTTERPHPSEPFCTGSRIVTPKASDPVASMPADEAYSGLEHYWKKYNLLKDSRSVHEILDDKEWQNFYHPTQRGTASAHLWYYMKTLRYFRQRILIILFKEHLVKHCSHRKVQMDDVLKFKKTFNIPSYQLVTGQVEQFYHETVGYRNKRNLPKKCREDLLRGVEKTKEELRDECRGDITEEVMRDIEEDTIIKVNQKFLAPIGYPLMELPR